MWACLCPHAPVNAHWCMYNTDTAGIHQSLPMCVGIYVCVSVCARRPAASTVLILKAAITFCLHHFTAVILTASNLWTHAVTRPCSLTFMHITVSHKPICWHEIWLLHFIGVLSCFNECQRGGRFVFQGSLKWQPLLNTSITVKMLLKLWVRNVFRLLSCSRVSPCKGHLLHCPIKPESNSYVKSQTVKNSTFNVYLLARQNIKNCWLLLYDYIKSVFPPLL